MRSLSIRFILLLMLYLPLARKGMSQWVSNGVTRSVSLGESLCRDAAGNIYGAGTFSCDLSIQGDTLFNPSCGTSVSLPLTTPRFDGYLVKYTANGQLIWSKQIIGDQTNSLFEVKGIAASSSAIFISGHYKGSLSFDGTVITNTTAVSDVFVASYDLNGNTLWVRSNFSRVAAAQITNTAIAAAADGTVVLTGKYTNTIVSPDDEDTLTTLNDALYLTAFNAAGTYLWMKSSVAKNAGSRAEGRDLWMDTDKNIFLTANVSDTVLIQTKQVPFATGTSGIFISKFASSGTLKWIRKENVAHVNSIELEKSQTHFLLGGDYKNNNVAGTTTLTTSAAYGGYVARYDTAGLLQWVKILTVPAPDSAAVVFGVSGDTDGGVYATGIFGKKTSAAAVLTTGTSTVTAKPGFTFFVVKYKQDGTVQWLQSYADGTTDAGNDIVAYDSSQVFITGYFNKSMRVDSTVISNTSAGLNSFVARIDDCPYVKATIQTPSATVACRKDSILLQAVTAPGMLYQWQKKGIDIPGATGAAYYAKDSALYRVVVRSSNTAVGCIKYSPGIFITINPLPDTSVHINGKLEFCEGSSATLNSSFGNTYQWLSSGTPISGATLLSYTTTLSGSYRVAVTTSKGCRDTSRTYTVVAEPVPAPLITPAGKFSICEGDTLVMNTTTGTNFRYLWYKNNIPLPNDTLASYKGYTGGRYKVFVKNRLGCGTYSPEDTLGVNSSPAAPLTFSGTLTSCSYNLPVLYTTADLSTSVQWIKDGIVLSAITGTSYTPSQSGQYHVKLTNAVNCSNESSKLNIVIHPQPSASAILSGSGSFCNGDSVRIDASAGPYSYIWQRNGTTITNAASAAYFSKQSGSFRAIIKDNNQCSDTSSIVSLTAFSVPVATIQSEGALTFCTGDSVKMNAAPGTGLQYEWFRDGITAGGFTTRSVFFKTSGAYSVRVYNSIGCSDTSSVIPVLVYTVPPNTVTANGLLEFCDGDQVVLSAPQDAAFSYQWRKNNVSISPGGNNSDYTATTSGNYTVDISISSKCSSTSAVRTVTVKPVIRPLITVDEAFISTSAFASYQWFRNGVLIPNADHQIYEVRENGQYTVKVSGTNGCSVDAMPVTICIPVPHIESNGNVLSATSGSAYQWYVNGVAISDATTQSYLVNATGDYKIKITRPDGCSSFSNTIRVCMPPPVITIGANHVLTSSAGLHYQWFLNGDIISGGDTRIIVATQSGDYTVQVEDLSGCISVSAPVTLLVDAVLNGAVYSAIRCYPNPFEDNLTIDASSALSFPLKASVYDTKGILVYQQWITHAGTEALQTEQMSAGSYILIMDTGANRYYYKIIKTPK